MVGDAARGSVVKIEEDAVICDFSAYNPIILIPELGEIVYGANSWWGEIKSEEDLKPITDFDIDNVWYVQVSKQLHKGMKS